jgi:hypothetical protein
MKILPGCLPCSDYPAQNRFLLSKTLPFFLAATKRKFKVKPVYERSQKSKLAIRQSLPVALA